MIITGEHDNGLLGNTIVKIEIKKGLLGVYKTNDNGNRNKPNNDEDWNFRKINWKENKPVVPINKDFTNIKTKHKFSHVIEYKTKDNKVQRIFINPTQWEIYKIKWNRGDLFWQRMTLYESIIAGLIVLLLQTTGNFIYNELIESDKNYPNKGNKVNTKRQQDSKVKILITPSNKDSLKGCHKDSLILK